MKGLVLAGGAGTRLRPITFSISKQLVPVANKPILWYVIEHLRNSGVLDIGVIISPETGEEIQQVTGNGDRFGVNLTYITQDKPRGLADAVKTARPFLGEDDFIMYLGDNLLLHDLDTFVWNRGQAESRVLLTTVKDPTKCGVVELENDKIIRLVEKPKEPKSNLALCGVYAFTPLIHKIIETLEPSARGEYEITDAIQGLMDAGHQVSYDRVSHWWKDTGSSESLLEANRFILESKTDPPISMPDNWDFDILEGRIWIEGSIITAGKSILRGPVIIGEGVSLENVFIGPYTAIGRNCKLKNCQIENSIVFEDASISETSRELDGCLIGRGAVIDGTPPIRGRMTCIIGDSSKVSI